MELQSLQPEIEKIQEVTGELASLITTNLTYKPPVYAGSYTLGDPQYYTISLNLTVKPSWLKRVCMNTFFGFKWVDAK